MGSEQASVLVLVQSRLLIRVITVIMIRPTGNFKAPLEYQTHVTCLFPSPEPGLRNGAGKWCMCLL